jgi:hypothetical protein
MAVFAAQDTEIGPFATTPSGAIATGDNLGDDAGELQPCHGDNSVANGRRLGPSTGTCGTWGRARDEQSDADLRGWTVVHNPQALSIAPIRIMKHLCESEGR